MKNKLDLSNKFIYIVGRNGSGKTTLIQNMIEQELIKTYRISYLDQYALKNIDRILISVEELIDTSSFFIKDSNFINNKKQILDYFNINHLLKNKTNELSGGEKQLILIVTQLLKDNDLYILDEPFNNLDSSVIDKLTKYLENLSKVKNIIVISHHLDYIVENSIVYEINNHEIVRKGGTSHY